MGRITIIGTGWTRGHLTMEAVELLRGADRIILHTDRCGCADWLREQGIPFESLDPLYEGCDDFDAHIEAAVAAVLRAAESGDVVYGVFDVRDRTAPPILRAGGDVAVVAGPPAEGALLALTTGETKCVEASDWEDAHISARENCLIRELDSRELAAEIKLKLMDAYPEEHGIWLMNAGEAPERLPLYALDRGARYDHRTCALVPAQRDIMALERFDAGHLNEIMRILCGPGGCPWDRAQTHESLRPFILEEAYEVIDAIDEGDPDHLYDELGDVLLQVALHAEIARKHGEFDIGDVTTAICAKMIHRHSHIFGADRAENPEQVLDIWNRNKMAERGQMTRTEALRSITRSLPALLRAVKVLKRSRDADNGSADAADAVERCRTALAALSDGADGEEALGAALFSLSDIARELNVDPEIALNRAVDRFIDRFERMEKALSAENKPFAPKSALDLRNLYWDSVKL